MVNYLTSCGAALLIEEVSFGSASISIPGSVSIRLSMLLGNRRIHRLMDPLLTPGAVVIDVGANIGINTIFAAQRVGTNGAVIAIEAAADNVASGTLSTQGSRLTL